MVLLKIEERSTAAHWSYDSEADVLYLSPGDPKPAEDVDIGGGMIVKYDEKSGEVVGLTIIGLRERLLRELEADAEL